MKEDLIRNLATIVENNSSWKWLGADGFLGNKATGYKGLKVLTEFFIEKNIFVKIGSSGLTPPSANKNKISKDFIRYLEEKNTYPDLFAKAKSMLEGREQGYFNDEVLLTFATVLYRLGREMSTEVGIETAGGLLEHGFTQLKVYRPELKEKIDTVEIPEATHLKGSSQKEQETSKSQEPPKSQETPKSQEPPKSQEAHTDYSSYSEGNYTGAALTATTLTASNSDSTIKINDEDTAPQLEVEEEQHTQAPIPAEDQKELKEPTAEKGKVQPKIGNEVKTEKDSGAREIPTEEPPVEEDSIPETPGIEESSEESNLKPRSSKGIGKGRYEVEVPVENQGARLSGIKMEALGYGLRGKKKKGIKPTHKNLEDTQNNMAKYDQRSNGKPQVRQRRPKPQKSGGGKIAHQVAKWVAILGATMGTAAHGGAQAKALTVVTGLIHLFI